MKLIFLLVIVFLLIISIINFLIHRRKRDYYLKAGNKWDGIVKELSRRK